MNVMRGKLNLKDMAGFAGIATLTIIDSRLAEESEKGYLKTEKIRGGIYQFILYSEPVQELILSNDSR